MIYFIRHGQTEYNRTERMQGQLDVPLNDTGRAQVKKIAVDVAKLNIDKIISSDLLRAKETAEIVNTKGLPLTFDNRIREFYFGMLQDRLLADITDAEWAQFRENPKTFKAETYEEVFARVKCFLDEIKAKKMDNLLIVTHGGAIEMMKYYKKNSDEFDYALYREICDTSEPVDNAKIGILNLMIIVEEMQRQLAEDENSNSLLITGNRSLNGIKYLSREIGIKRPSIIFIDSIYAQLKENYENREGQILTDKEFIARLEAEKKMGLTELKEYVKANPDHCSVLYNLHNADLTESMQSIMQRFKTQTRRIEDE